jgi:hypothetical protein
MPDARDISSVLFGRRELVVPTEADDYWYLRFHWSAVYTIVRPAQDDDTWKAIARFGNQDQLVADTADELLNLIRHHYGPETEGYTEMLMAKLGKKYT